MTFCNEMSVPPGFFSKAAPRPLLGPLLALLLASLRRRRNVSGD